MLFAVELLVFLALIAALFVIMKWSKVKKTTLTESQIFINEELKEALAEVEDEDSGGSDEWGMKGYKNVALFGVDAGGTRSDTIIIASINTDTNEVKMCSIYRDTYLNIDSMDNPNYTKANAAYSKGGPEQAIRMINMNTDMNVDDFITVDFDALEDIIDDLGGVEINVQPEEIDYINDYQFSIVMDLGGPNEGKIKNPRNFIAVTQAGPQTLNGLQATAYCRIRYTSGSDFRRTERQREVISQIVQKAKGASISQLNKILDDVLPQITTSFSAAEFAGYASRVGSYTIAETRGFPFENVTGKIGKQSMVVPDTLLNNVEEMHTFLFGESSYSPTPNVQTISEKIQADRTASGL
ncbi:MAG: LCP family protein [Lachnospiraceae bacterium]|nr:LCP family protein [Lachnospiraceae bacterium]